MQANIISDNGDNSGFRALVYGPPTREMLNYIDNSMNMAATALGDLGRGFIEKSASIFESINGAEAIERGKRLLNIAQNTVSDESIYYIDEVNMMTPNRMMKQYISYEPMYSKKILSQTANGYDDYNVVDYNLEHSPVFMNVMDGVETYNPHMNVETTFYEHTYNDVDLDNFDKQSVLDTWRNVRNSIIMGIDPATGEEL